MKNLLIALIYMFNFSILSAEFADDIDKEEPLRIDLTAYTDEGKIERLSREYEDLWKLKSKKNDYNDEKIKAYIESSSDDGRIVWKSGLIKKKDGASKSKVGVGLRLKFGGSRKK